MKVNMFPCHTCAHAVHTYVAKWNDAKINWEISDDDSKLYGTRRQKNNYQECDNLNVLHEFFEDVLSIDLYHFEEMEKLTLNMIQKNIVLTDDCCLNKVMFGVQRGAKSGAEHGMAKKAAKPGRVGKRTKIR